jgi:hypothetical protein
MKNWFKLLAKLPEVIAAHSARIEHLEECVTELEQGAEHMQRVQAAYDSGAAFNYGRNRRTGMPERPVAAALAGAEEASSLFNTILKVRRTAKGTRGKAKRVAPKKKAAKRK